VSHFPSHGKNGDKDDGQDDNFKVGFDPGEAAKPIAGEQK
jgi:hypothetical protein